MKLTGEIIPSRPTAQLIILGTIPKRAIRNAKIIQNSASFKTISNFLILYIIHRKVKMDPAIKKILKINDIYSPLSFLQTALTAMKKPYEPYIWLIEKNQDSFPLQNVFSSLL